MTATGPADGDARPYHSIGDVLALLRGEFPDVTISKIRFLEGQGLIAPERTASGFRKFYEEDIERLRWILEQQRRHFLPLKVIKERLSGTVATAGAEGRSRSGRARRRQTGASAPLPFGGAPRAEDGAESGPEPVSEAVSGPGAEPAAGPDARAGPGAGAPSRRSSRDPGRVAASPDPSGEGTLTREELAERCSLPVRQIVEMASFSLLPRRTVAGVEYFEPGAAEIAGIVAELARHGIEARHLNGLHHAARHEAVLYAQVVAPLLRRRNPESRARAMTLAAELSALGLRLHGRLVEHALKDQIGG